MARKTALDRLVALIAHLRSPDGCPWDRKQTHVSLLRHLREETRELEGALKKGTWHEIEDELGDVLLQILLHAQIGKERGLFDIQDVARSQYVKLKRRHPHVFGNGKATSAEDVMRDWDRIKDQERRLRQKDVARRRKNRAN